MCTYWYKQECCIISTERTGWKVCTIRWNYHTHPSSDEVIAITCQEGGFVRKVSEDADTQHQTARCEERQCSHLRVVNKDRFEKHIWRCSKTMSPSSWDGENMKRLGYSDWNEALWLTQTQGFLSVFFLSSLNSLLWVTLKIYVPLPFVSAKWIRDRNNWNV